MLLILFLDKLSTCRKEVSYVENDLHAFGYKSAFFIFDIAGLVTSSASFYN